MSDYEHDPNYHQGRSEERVSAQSWCFGISSALLIGGVVVTTIWYGLERLYQAIAF